MVFRPQSSGKVECINRTLKTQLSKLTEHYLHWDQLLPITLLRVRCSPTKQTVFSPFEIFYGCPLSIVKAVHEDLKEIASHSQRQQMQALSSAKTSISYWVREQLQVSVTTEVQPFKPGDMVCVKE